jgi:hypothetical protein
MRNIGFETNIPQVQENRDADLPVTDGTNPEYCVEDY